MSLIFKLPPRPSRIDDILTKDAFLLPVRKIEDQDEKEEKVVIYQDGYRIPVTALETIYGQAAPIWGFREELKSTSTQKDLITVDAKQYQAQFTALLDSLIQWGKHNGINDDALSDLSKLKENFFHKHYTGDQKPFYFTGTKQALEKIWHIITFKTDIPQSTKISKLKTLNTQMAVCDSGAYTNLLEMADELIVDHSIESVLAKMRRNIADAFAANYCQINNVYEGTQIHISTALYTYQANCDWGPIIDISKIKERYDQRFTHIDADVLLNFDKYFTESYSPQAILNCAAKHCETEMNKELNSISLKTLKEDKETRWMPYNQQLMDAAKKVAAYVGGDKELFLEIKEDTFEMRYNPHLFRANFLKFCKENNKFFQAKLWDCFNFMVDEKIYKASIFGYYKDMVLVEDSSGTPLDLEKFPRNMNPVLTMKFVYDLIRSFKIHTFDDLKFVIAKFKPGSLEHRYIFRLRGLEINKLTKDIRQLGEIIPLINLKFDPNFYQFLDLKSMSFTVEDLLVFLKELRPENSDLAVNILEEMDWNTFFNIKTHRTSEAWELLNRCPEVSTSRYINGKILLSKLVDDEKPNMEMIKKISEKCSDIELTTAFFLSARQNSIEPFKFFLENKAIIDPIQTKLLEPILLDLIEKNKFDWAELLLSYKPIQFYSFRYEYQELSKMQNMFIEKSFLITKPSKNILDFLLNNTQLLHWQKYAGEHRYTILSYAIKENHFDIMNWLLNTYVNNELFANGQLTFCLILLIQKNQFELALSLVQQYKSRPHYWNYPIIQPDNYDYKYEALDTALGNVQVKAESKDYCALLDICADYPQEESYATDQAVSVAANNNNIPFLQYLIKKERLFFNISNKETENHLSIILKQLAINKHFDAARTLFHNLSPGIMYGILAPFRKMFSNTCDYSKLVRYNLLKIVSPYLLLQDQDIIIQQLPNIATLSSAEARNTDDPTYHHHDLMFLSHLRSVFTDKNNEYKKIIMQAITLMIEAAISDKEVVQLIKALDIARPQIPFFSPRSIFGSKLSDKWRNSPVTGDWLTVIKQAKNRIISLLEKNQSIVNPAQISTETMNFLREKVGSHSDATVKKPYLKLLETIKKRSESAPVHMVHQQIHMQTIQFHVEDKQVNKEFKPLAPIRILRM